MSALFLLMLSGLAALVTVIALYFNKIILKFLAVAMIIAAANAVYFSLDFVKGWPTEQDEFAKGILASVVIVNPSSEDEGGIYVGIFIEQSESWMAYKYPRYAPKTFYVKYSNDRAAAFEKAAEALKEGKEVRINGIPAESGGSGEEAAIDEAAIGAIVQQMISDLISKAGDTYKPETPNDIEIVEPKAPPQKGTQQ